MTLYEVIALLVAATVVIAAAVMAFVTLAWLISTVRHAGERDGSRVRRHAPPE